VNAGENLGDEVTILKRAGVSAERDFVVAPTVCVIEDGSGQSTPRELAKVVVIQAII
jgi:hypothetical protein